MGVSFYYQVAREGKGIEFFIWNRKVHAHIWWRLEVTDWRWIDPKPRDYDQSSSSESIWGRRSSLIFFFFALYYFYMGEW